ncbi:MAG: hypothetical protein NVV82_05960 [Sporocytophaga sp.]|nr:hypothetical protein [Sporocytophaga sp.]
MSSFGSIGLLTVIRSDAETVSVFFSGTLVSAPFWRSFRLGSLIVDLSSDFSAATGLGAAGPMLDVDSEGASAGAPDPILFTVSAFFF